MLKTAIITDKLGTYEAKCTTKIAKEAVARGHKVYETLASDISHVEGKLTAKARIYDGSEAEAPQIEEHIDLAKMDVIHLRTNPPIDMTYISMLYLLERIKDKVLIVNNPEAIIRLPEKIFPLQFPGFTPATLITKDIEEIRKFIAKHKEIILKPLYEYGGNGIKKVKLAEFEAEQDFINNWLTESKLPLIAQPFLNVIDKGDKRIFFIGGEVAGAFLRRPPEGSYVANISKGGSITKTTLTTREKEFAKILGPILKKNGIYICGIDVIDDFVTEINITSSVGFSQMEELYNEKPQIKLWDIIENEIA